MFGNEGSSSVTERYSRWLTCAVFFQAAPISKLPARMRKSGAFSVFFSAGTILTLTLTVSVRTVPAKPSFATLKVPIVVMMIYLSCEVAPIAALSVSDRAGNGRAASRVTAAQRRTRSAQKICRRGRHRRGKIFEPESCGTEPEAQPIHCQDFRHSRPGCVSSMLGLTQALTSLGMQVTRMEGLTRYLVAAK